LYQSNAFVLFLSTLAAVFVAVPLSVFLVTTLVAPKLQAQTALNAAAQPSTSSMVPVANTTATTNTTGCATVAVPASQQAAIQTTATVNTASFMKPAMPSATPTSFTQTVKNYAETNIINSNNTIGSYNSKSYTKTNINVHNKSVNVNSNNVDSNVNSNNPEYNQVNIGSHDNANGSTVKTTNNTHVTTNVNSNNSIGNTFNNHSNNGNNSNNTVVNKPTFKQTNNINSNNTTTVGSYNPVTANVTGHGDIDSKVIQS
jgi:hypothetical protein